MNNRILVVDDEKEIRDLIEIYLKNDGYEVIKASCGAEALEIVSKEDIDLLVLDIMMPGIDGMELCRLIRKNSNIPILMLSAKSENMDKIQGILTGADDYMVKPFDPLELTVRIKSLLRRAYYFNLDIDRDNNLITIENLVIDKKKHKVTIEGEEVLLTAREFDILYLLASNRGQVFSSEEIFEKVWKEKYYQSNNTIMVHMSRLREKIKKGNNVIHTVWGVGYKIEK
ncbi:response regulator transcription factor [Clostridium bornimense]|uniref:response regulator transcription factor n=1 Tax=Clostridium bornimense TaxID=1216932 RepID=UPI001C102196|nr:response regulator transcription factor [Clostridium bornimense]MBU5316984.1 response regulator transcription factor [Clostridium bornimense]